MRVTHYPQPKSLKSLRAVSKKERSLFASRIARPRCVAIVVSATTPILAQPIFLPCSRLVTPVPGWELRFGHLQDRTHQFRLTLRGIAGHPRPSDCNLVD